MDFVGQALDHPYDPIDMYLHSRFPHRIALYLRWAKLVSGIATVEPLPTVEWAAKVGQAIELAVAFDLADALPLPGLLALMPPADADRLLALTGWDDHDASTSDGSHAVSHSGPKQTSPNRFPSSDGGLDELAQRLILLAELNEDVFALETRGPADPQEVRRKARELHRDRQRVAAAGHTYLRPVIEAYLGSGREQLRRLGGPVIVGHRFDQGFAVCDLVAAGTLIDVKCFAEPIGHLDSWTDQLLKYLLLDRDDALKIRSVGVYLARQSLLLREPVDTLLPELTGTPGIRIEDLREEFRQVAAPDIAAFQARRAKAVDRGNT